MVEKTSDIQIFIFNISKIFTRGDIEFKFHKFNENLGGSFADVLRSFDDLVICMDEAHRYYAPASKKAINYLNPVLGLEYTATPKSTNKNIIYHYGLEDGAGKFLKIPVVMGRTNTAGYSDDDIEEMKLKDGIKLHERRKSIVYKYCIDNHLEQVKPIVLIACKDTTHARKIKEKIDSDAFFGGRYVGKVIEIDSSTSGAETEENIQKLLTIEKNTNPIEIVLHVYKLKEGWDVNNLFTIIPLNAAKDFDTETYKFKDLFEFGKVKGVQGKIYTSQTPLNKDVQGIVLFSRGKLVQEHSSFDDRANDNFFQYMSGSFDVDFIDNSFDVDNCSTDRKSLAWDIDENEELFKLQELIKKLVSIAQKKWREQRKAEKKRKVSSHGYDVDEWIKALNPAERPLAQKLTNAIIENDDIAEDIAADYIGCIKDMYSFEGFKQFTAELDELQELDNEHAIKLLTDWNTIEAKEYAKIAIGRVKTIEQFEKFIQTNASERDVIQKFLEEFPWLLDAKMSKFEREITYTKLLKQKFNDESILPESNRRLDFLCTNSAGVIHVIELKRPRIKLTMKEIQQICEYVEFIETQFPQTQGNVKGFLISDNMTYEPGANKYRKGLEKEGIFIKSYSDLLAEARRYNDDLYKMYEDISMKKNNKSDK